jgi:hypothetical protein
LVKNGKITRFSSGDVVKKKIIISKMRKKLKKKISISRPWRNNRISSENGIFIGIFRDFLNIALG